MKRTKLDMEKNKETYYKINISYEIPYNILDDSEHNLGEARNNLYTKLESLVDENRYEIFSVRLVLHQLKDNLNYLINYSSFFRSLSGLPMEEYMAAKEIKEAVMKELEEFFKVVDCEYRYVNIKTFN